jgi:DNA transformation protein
VGDEVPETLERMRNLGPIIAGRLRTVGIETPDELRKLGAIEAYIRLKRAFRVETTHAQLYALHGAVNDVSWSGLPEEARAALRDAAARRL